MEKIRITFFFKDKMEYMYDNKSKTARVSTRGAKSQARTVEREGEQGLRADARAGVRTFGESLATGEG